MTAFLDRPFGFDIRHEDTSSGARLGILQTPHGDVETPVFMPVGTAGSVKAVTFDQVEATGARLILGNTYHLHIRPGHPLIQERGGLHRFLSWRGAMLTDSAGFQVFSLADLATVTDDGVKFRSHLDGSRLYFTPEFSMEIQLGLGADIVMAFDQCVAADASEGEVSRAVDRTQRWLGRCVATVGPNGRVTRDGYERVLFGIMQGGTLVAERRRHATMLIDLDLPGYAIGGLSVGESKAELHDLSAVAAEMLPRDRPRYLMGVGYPDDIVAAVLAGVDMFDCVLPTRMARTGTVLTWDGRLVVKNREHERDDRPIDETCPCPVCRRHSRAYIRHLFQARELLGPILATQHNLWFYQELMRGIRAAIADNRLSTYGREVTSRWNEGEARRLADVAQRERVGRKR